MAKIRTNITIDPETKERLLKYAADDHLRGGVSGAIEHLVWKSSETGRKRDTKEPGKARMKK